MASSCGWCNMGSAGSPLLRPSESPVDHDPWCQSPTLVNAFGNPLWVLKLNSYQVANLRELVNMLRASPCDTGDWLGELHWMLDIVPAGLFATRPNRDETEQRQQMNLWDWVKKEGK